MGIHNHFSFDVGLGGTAGGLTAGPAGGLAMAGAEGCPATGGEERSIMTGGSSTIPKRVRSAFSTVHFYTKANGHDWVHAQQNGGAPGWPVTSPLELNIDATALRRTIKFLRWSLRSRCVTSPAAPRVSLSEG